MIAGVRLRENDGTFCLVLFGGGAASRYIRMILQSSESRSKSRRRHVGSKSISSSNIKYTTLVSLYIVLRATKPRPVRGASSRAER